MSAPKDLNEFVCPECVDEIDYSKKSYEKEKLSIYEEHLEKHYATIIVSKWRGIVAKVSPRRSGIVSGVNLTYRFTPLWLLVAVPLRHHEEIPRQATGHGEGLQA